MRWYWLVVALGSAITIVESDDSKLKRWRKRDESCLARDRVLSLLVLALAVWQLLVMWKGL